MKSTGTVEVKVTRLTPDGERVLVVDLAPSDPTERLPTFEAGAHIDVHIGGFVRPYSLIEGNGGLYRIGVLRERDGRGGSAAIHDTLRVGDRVQVSAPRSTFALDRSARHSVFIAGGIGITPLIAMADRLHADGASFELHAYTSSESTLPLRELLASRPWRDRVRERYSSSGDTFRGAAQVVIGGPRPGVVIYVCGPLGMVASATAFAGAAGWPRSAVRVERFARGEPVESTGDAFEVIAASSGLRMPVGTDETIAAALQRHGFEVSLSCEQGICGSCITAVLAGIPDHRDDVQTDAEHAANTLINVCCSRALTPALTLDV